MAFRFRAAHLVIAGFVAQLAVAASWWLGAPSAGAEESALPPPTAWQFAGYGAFMVACVAPYPFLASLQHRRLHFIGRWAALLMGWLCVVGIFWAVQGLFLVAAAVWAMWKEKPQFDDRPTGRSPADAPPTREA